MWARFGCAFALALATAVHAGVVMTSELGPVGQQAHRATSLVDRDRVRVETASGDVILFRGDRDVVWILRPKDRTYVELNRDSMKTLQDQAEAARERMKAELEKLPPEQRAELEKMMRETPTRVSEPVTVKPTGRSDQVGGLACHEVEVYRGAAKEYEACVADWATAGVTTDDLAGLKQAGSWREKVGRAASAADPNAGEGAMELLDRLDGLPVRVRRFHDGKAVSEMRVTSVEKKPLDATLFEVPEGYRSKGVGRGP
jgi:hypothetical protein